MLITKSATALVAEEDGVDDVDGDVDHGGQHPEYYGRDRGACSCWCAAAGEITVDDAGHSPDVPPGVDLSAYRIVQEALTNVLKHAGAAKVRIRLRYGADS